METAGIFAQDKGLSTEPPGRRQCQRRGKSAPVPPCKTSLVTRPCCNKQGHNRGAPRAGNPECWQSLQPPFRLTVTHCASTSLLDVTPRHPGAHTRPSQAGRCSFPHAKRRPQGSSSCCRRREAAGQNLGTNTWLRHGAVAPGPSCALPVLGPRGTARSRGLQALRRALGQPVALLSSCPRHRLAAALAARTDRQTCPRG